MSHDAGTNHILIATAIVLVNENDSKKCKEIIKTLSDFPNGYASA
jgi:hypothetical protein